MANEAMDATLVLRKMAVADIPAVQALEAAAFDDGWPATAFERELRPKSPGRFVVLERGEAHGRPIVGFGGLWLGVDEAHITAVAVEEAERRRGYGRALVHTLVAVAREMGMDSVTLEVRPSNAAARGLYRLYGFHEVGGRRGYYRNPAEDALIMTTEPLGSAAYVERYARLDGELARLLPGLAMLQPGS